MTNKYHFKCLDCGMFKNTDSIAQAEYFARLHMRFVGHVRSFAFNNSK